MSAIKRDVMVADGCNRQTPLNFRVVVHGDDEMIGSLTFDRPWTYVSLGMSRDDLERVSRAITEVLDATRVES
jgi:ribosome maturation factor RimP